MSQENVEMVRRGFAAYERGDLDAAVTDFSADCVFVPTGALPGGRAVYQGPEGYKRYIGWLKDEFENAHVHVNELADAGDHVLVSLTLRGRGKQSGAATTWNLWHVWTVRNGRVVHGQAFTSEAEALAAAGLEE